MATSPQGPAPRLPRGSARALAAVLGLVALVAVQLVDRQPVAPPPSVPWAVQPRSPAAVELLPSEPGPPPPPPLAGFEIGAPVPAREPGDQLLVADRQVRDWRCRRLLATGGREP
jgi:hypothetical protein